MRLFLVGFMCSGKSTVGKVLALRLRLPFVDIDRVVEASVGPLLPYVQRHGEAAFREQETRVLDELLAGPSAVIATGGGTPAQGANMERMLAAGTVVWLDLPMEVLLPRIERSGGDRPLLHGLKGEALQRRVQQLLDERSDIYARAHIIVQAAVPPTEVAARITSVLGQES